MNRLNTCSESNFIKIFFAFLTAGLFITALILPDREEIFIGAWRIMCSTVKAPTNVFDIVGFAPSFLTRASSAPYVRVYFSFRRQRQTPRLCWAFC